MGKSNPATPDGDTTDAGAAPAPDVPQELPTRGGTYTRNPDGSLTRDEPPADVAAAAKE